MSMLEKLLTHLLVKCTQMVVMFDPSESGSTSHQVRTCACRVHHALLPAASIRARPIIVTHRLLHSTLRC